MATKKDNASLPFNLEEEQIVLGIMLIDDIARAEAMGSLDKEDFYEGFAANQLVFEALSRIYKKGLSLADDISFLHEELSLMNALETVGGVDYIASLMDKVTTTVNFEEHIKILKDNRILRDLLKLMRNTDLKYLKDGANDIQNFVDVFTNGVGKINDRRRISQFITTNELVDRYRSEMPLRAGNNSNLAVNAITSGYGDLDFYTHGFKRGEYIIIAGRPSMGKTALALNIALRSGKAVNRTVGIFSLEMPSQQLIQRMLATDGRIESSNLTTGRLTEEETVKLESAYENVAGLKLHIDDSSENTVHDIIAKSTKLKNSHPDLSLIIIDYLSFIGGDSTLKSEQEKVSDISRRLKSMAKTLEVPVIVLSQLSRNPEGRPSQKPMLSDLRSSGAIEQDADIVMLLYREGYYLNQKQEMKSNNPSKSGYAKPMSDAAERKRNYETKLNDGGNSMAEVIIAKNRNGATGVCLLLFNFKCGSFDQIPKEDKEEVREIFGNSVDAE